MESTRRLATIMFTDIVGYTKLMQASESAAIKIRQRHREVFDTVTARFNGKIINYYGDGTLSIFYSTVHAVECAIELQKQFRQKPAVPLRIGMHTGDIIITDADIIGDSVNLASRVESMGIAGAVLVSEKVVEEIRNQDGLPVKHIGNYHFKNVERSMGIYALTARGLKVPRPHQLKGKVEEPSIPKGISRFKVSRINASLLLILLIGSFFSVWFFKKQAKIQWATYEALPLVEELVHSSWRDYTEAYNLAMEADRYIPDNIKLNDLISKASFQIDIMTEPEGATIYVKEYEQPNEEWNYLGVTPLEGVRLPRGFLRWKIEKEGYNTVYAADPTFDIGDITNLSKYELMIPKHFHRRLDDEESIPIGMTRVKGGLTSSGMFKDFFIDRFEVTNRDYKDFVSKGGYQNPEPWKHEFLQNAEILSWENAMMQFVDQTGRLGPSTWEAGDFPRGEDEYPVGGISWYEAAAYAEFVGKALPTVDHWGLARGENTFIISWPEFGGTCPFCSF